VSKRKEDKGRQPPWISVYRHTWKSAAWKILSIGARALYVELAANYNTKMQNAVFMSARTGSERLNVRKDNITLWQRELEHYGFLVKVQGAHLGIDGEGKAARYRMTDRWYAGKEPTYDFQNWDGVIFEPKKRKASAAKIAQLNELNRRSKKQDQEIFPVPGSGTPCPKRCDISKSELEVKNGNKRPRVWDISAEADRPTVWDITSLTISRSEVEPRVPRASSAVEDAADAAIPPPAPRTNRPQCRAPAPA
jgi:hypothetical protein